MKLLILDGETYFSKEYTLRTLTPAEYVLDPRFEMIGLAVKEAGQQGQWIEGPDVGDFFKSLDPADTITVSHNALFDNCIWAYRYNFVPAQMICTLGMARAVLNTRQNSLASIAKYLGLSEKGDALAQAIGLHLADIKARPNFYRAYKAYALKDAYLCEQIYYRLIKGFPSSEVALQDLVLRCAVEPVLHANVPLLTEHLTKLRRRKDQLLRECGYDKAALMSTIQFKEALENLGVEIQTKVSGTGKIVPAFAKTDSFMRELCEYQGPDEDINFQVQTLANARLCHKSTIEETRAERFLKVSSLGWANGQTMLPVPLRYGGAHTHRLSGEWKLNLQNLPRDQDKSQLRSALLAPPGHKIVKADLSQIEARIVALLAEQEDLLGWFRRGDDVYASFGCRLFGKVVDKVNTPNERWIAKTAVLGLGYGCGKDRFFQMVVSLSKQYGINLEGLFDEDMARWTVDTYRRVFNRVPLLWKQLDRHLLGVLGTQQRNPTLWSDFGPVRIFPGRIRLPNRLYLKYDLPDQSLYGAKLLENITQALARIVLMDAALRLADRELRFVLQAHDELVFVIPDDQVDQAKEIIMEELIKPPHWMPGVPLAAEIMVGDNYGRTQ